MNDDLKATLESLLQANIDSRHALERATNHVSDVDCVILLRRLAEERSTHAYQLQEALAMEREFPRAKGTLTSHARRAWITVRGTLSGQDETVVLPEVAKVEEQLEQAYAAALPLFDDSDIGEMIAAHYRNVVTGCEAISNLHKSIKGVDSPGGG